MRSCSMHRSMAILRPFCHRCVKELLGARPSTDALQECSFAVAVPMEDW